MTVALAAATAADMAAERRGRRRSWPMDATRWSADTTIVRCPAEDGCRTLHREHEPGDGAPRRASVATAAATVTVAVEAQRDIALAKQTEAEYRRGDNAVRATASADGMTTIDAGDRRLMLPGVSPKSRLPAGRRCSATLMPFPTPRWPKRRLRTLRRPFRRSRPAGMVASHDAKPRRHRAAADFGREGWRLKPPSRTNLTNAQTDAAGHHGGDRSRHGQRRLHDGPRLRTLDDEDHRKPDRRE